MKKLGRHTSAAADLKRSIMRLTNARNCRHAYAPGHLKIQMEVDAGFKVNGYSGNGVTDLYVYCDEDHKTTVKGLIES